MTLKEDTCTVYLSIVISLKTVIVWSVERLTTDRTVQVLNPVRKINFIFFTLTGPGAHLSLLSNCYRLFSPRAKWPGLAVDYPPPSRAKINP